MKKKLFYFVITGFFLINITIVAQSTKLNIKTINGTEYYIYNVEISEGLFAIGRKFNVSVEEIAKANPEIKGGLKVGQQILVPKKPESSFHEPTKKATIKTQEFIQHKVIKKQTLFAISNKYNVSQEEIKKYNPQINKGLTEGMLLQIPKQQIETNTIPAKNEKKIDAIETTSKSTIHHVQKDETLYSISKKYNTTVLDIIKNNPGTTTNIEIGSELKIPIVDTLNMSLPIIIDNKTANVSITKKEIVKKDVKTIKIAYLLPFMLNDEKSDPFIDRFIDFYAGSLLAINEAKEKGISLEIFVYDTEKSDNKIIDVLNYPELKTVDLIVGPALSNQVSRVAEFAKDNKINTLIPFTAKVPELEENPYLFQFNPGTESELVLSKEILTGKYKKANLIFAEILGISSNDEGRIWADVLKKELSKEERAFSTLKLITAEDANFNTVLKKDENNIVIFNSDNFDLIYPFMNTLLVAQKNHKIELFKQFRWRNQTKETPTGFYLTPFKTDINTNLLNNYNNIFSETFDKEVGNDSPRYDLLGYDLSNYFISFINQHATKFAEKINMFNFPKGIQSDLKFERKTTNSGFINQQLYLVEDK